MIVRWELAWTLGEINFSEKTLYDFRSRVYRHMITHPEQEDLIFGQFLNLAKGFLQTAHLTATEQRMDSTMFMSNIKKAGRISLAFDVLVKAVKVIPEALLPENLKEVLKPEFKNDTLYSAKPSEADSKLETLLSLCLEAKRLLENSSDSETLRIVGRFINEQTHYDESSKRLKANKEISPRSLQLAYDEDATYRTKGKHRHTDGRLRTYTMYKYWENYHVKEDTRNKEKSKKRVDYFTRFICITSVSNFSTSLSKS